MLSPLVVIPAHNEENSIASVVEDLHAKGYRNTLVVDDASTDRTYSIASQCSKVISLPYNLGAWKATQAGIRYAYEQGIEQVVTFDADGQHLAQTLPPLLALHKRENFDIVIGSCTSRGSLARHIAWGVFRRLSGIEVKDLTSGLRVYNRKAMAVLSSEQATMLEYQDVGVLLLLKNFKVSKTEVPVKMTQRADGISRIFYSWGAVVYYMAYTTMLCLSKVSKTYHLSIDDDINLEKE
ncbi:glycosyl transferase [Pseudoalteromonas sp. SW0106-04]|uniref:glycosyltransferase family 2 protein n=1 Tax=Pseudoalteromonas sp. SW0106-04 TaxID=1702169 RepID=UPI0006B46BFC|nr:glycosyltransferase family 2 protein [Pseudoalteromonas sp. SW0106-04]GAP74581.1 glycosyl transferase [Pseudoalteromonas sp. SW0106-04]